MSLRGSLDLRGPSRWSKTAAIVVLLVFALMVGVSIAGLYAFAQGREADMARRRGETRDLVKARLDDLRQEVRHDLGALLAQAAQVDTPPAWRDYLATSDGQLVQGLVVSDRGELSWVDRSTLLDVPRQRLQDWAAAQAQVVDAARAAADAARKETAKAVDETDLAAALDMWCALLEENPVVTSPKEGDASRWPLALTWVPEMLEAARTAPRTSAQDRVRIGRAIRAALTVMRLARGLPDVRPDELRTALADANERMRLLLDAVRPGGDELAWEFERFQAVTAVLDDPAAGGTLRRAAESARLLLGEAPSVGRVLMQYAPPEIVGLVVLPPPEGGHPPLAVLRLARGPLEAWIAERVQDPRMERLGIEVRVVGPQRGGGAADADAEGEDTLVAEASLVDMEGAWNPPFRLRAHRVAEPASQADAGAWSHWLVLVLAVLGIAVGGWVLVRVLTREMRLARLKADFVGNLSHELKTPITSIAMFTEMLRDGKLEGAEDRAEAYEVLDTECKRLERTVARMLDVARREAGGSPYAMEVADLRLAVRKALDRFRRIVPDRGLHLAAKLGTQPLPVLHDAEAIEDVVANLLGNAWKYRRGEEANIRLTLAVDGKYVRLALVDDGVGIPRSERRRVFETFYRAEQYLTQSVSGSGLGLALVRTIVRGHGGKVRARGGPEGVGTTLEVLLPLARGNGHRDGKVTARGNKRPSPRSDGDTTVRRGTPSSRSPKTLDPR
ncbi:MAG: HAMP domain-containing histidine kinase [Planctomycetes bacterium]|nr:HAMP domain-containing histidine kinase [Planctomycetota bacterium]MCB9824709.1 HAMP domain-containing histidine kinase [Planctomycetota bacterium]MCB9899880.1 HAMP domain-containing histidine kinase [Planctomycetota bacterium]